MAVVLIRNAQLWQRGLADLRLTDGRIAGIGRFEPQPGDDMIDANGGALLPGLHDHHIHLAATAVKAQSLVCGPPEVASEAQLAERLSMPGSGWIRGILYHESVMGLPDAATLDTLQSARALRIQHRSGRMWLFNSAGLDLVLEGAAPPPGLERENGHFTGRLFDEDDWLRSALASSPPSFAAISAQLAAYGVTGITDMSPRNDPVMAAHFAAQAEMGDLQQHCIVSGNLLLGTCAPSPYWQLGPAKLHLHENALPGFDQTVEFICAAHAQHRPIASHCTTETELVFTLAALETAGVMNGDRIEHCGIATDVHIAGIARLGLAVVSQPHFITERGDHYLSGVEPRLHDALYRLAAFNEAGVTLAGGSDAPFGSADPWAAMAAAVSRSTLSGTVIGGHEALSPEAALALYLADPLDLPRQRSIAVGDQADLCLLDRPWEQARERLSSADVRATFIHGRIVQQRIVQQRID